MEDSRDYSENFLWFLKRRGHNNVDQFFWTDRSTRVCICIRTSTFHAQCVLVDNAYSVHGRDCITLQSWLHQCSE